MTPPSTSRRPQLADLSEEDRARLTAEARAADEEKASEKAVGRAEQFAKLIRERDHIDGCPVSTGAMPALGRVEAYGSVKPASPKTGEPAKSVSIVRCIECGGSIVKPLAIELLLEELDAVETDDDDDPDA